MGRGEKGAVTHGTHHASGETCGMTIGPHEREIQQNRKPFAIEWVSAVDHSLYSFLGELKRDLATYIKSEGISFSFLLWSNTWQEETWGRKVLSALQAEGYDVKGMAIGVWSEVMGHDCLYTESYAGLDNLKAYLSVHPQVIHFSKVGTESLVTRA